MNSSKLVGVTNLLVFALLSFVAFVLFYYVGERIYFKGVMGVSEAAAKRKKLTKDELHRNTTKNSWVTSICRLG